jgi:hypothetical protein
LKNYADQGPAIVKLDVAVADIHRETDKLAISVRFVNSGRYPIRMSTPDRWSRQWSDSLRVGGKNTADATRWSVDLAALPLVNRHEFPDEIITIAAGASVSFRFLAIPDEKIKRGTYRLNAFVVTGIGGDGVAGTMGRVSFHSDRGNPATVTFDHDYPSTPGERENYEAQKRETMSSQPVYPGDLFPEDGYYRVVSDSGQRSRFVKRFDKGGIAPEAAHMVDEREQPIHGTHPGCMWEADPVADVFAPDIRCAPGKPCPRTGRWFAHLDSDTTTWPPVFDDSLDEVIQCREGQTMPNSREAGEWIRDRLFWEWIGV